MLEDEELEFEGQEDPETDYAPSAMEFEKNSINYGIYSQLTALANFYSRIQNSYKTVAFTWLIASFVGIGYSLSQKGANLPLNPLWISAFIAVAAILGITLLWYLDIAIYQTYFYGVIVEQSKLEKTLKWLPKTNYNIAYTQSHTKNDVSQSYFYLGCNVILIAVLFFMMQLIFDKLIGIFVFPTLFIMIVYFLKKVMKKIEHPSPSPVKKAFIHHNLDAK